MNGKNQVMSYALKDELILILDTQRYHHRLIVLLDLLA